MASFPSLATLGLSPWGKAFFMFAVAVLDALLRTHDDRPDEAIARLPGLLASPDLSAAALSRAAWLANHLLGEKKGDWRGAWVLLKNCLWPRLERQWLRHCVVAATRAGGIVRRRSAPVVRRLRAAGKKRAGGAGS
ncbi:hypothetical protein [Chromobacterium phragmitis]|uniref:Uncharacterized protein n=1 Tax=Chromobacterium phragmitis TaxID=2202141 RepID=A0ABV0IN16_9NEIS